jgi:hypothetical protein
MEDTFENIHPYERTFATSNTAATHTGTWTETETKATTATLREVHMCKKHSLQCHLYCTVDKQAVCSRCAATEHQGHAVRAVEDEARWLRSELHSASLDIEIRASVGRMMLVFAAQQQAEKCSVSSSSSDDDQSLPTPLRSSAEHTDIGPDTTCSPCAVSIKESIRLQFAKFRSALDCREQELLQELVDISATEKHMLQFFLNHTVSNLVSPCQQFSNKAKVNLQIKDDYQFISSAIGILDTVDDIRKMSEGYTGESLDHRTIEYTDVSTKISKLLSSIYVSCVDVVPHMSQCHAIESNIRVGVLTIVHVELCNYQGVSLLRIGEGDVLSVQLLSINETCVTVTPTYSVYDNDDGTYRILYSIPKQGYYNVSVCYRGHQLGRQPLALVIY